MKSEDSIDEDTSTALGCDRLRYRNKRYHLAEPINKHENASILVSVF
uniref:Uncharacterized protein n=1 Tax=Peronospora matthiolae TaxID=2874970 RepID=A0AAV1UWI5_9STRA